MFTPPFKSRLPAPHEALLGRATPIDPGGDHFVSGRALAGPYPAHLRLLDVGLGCFWGAERAFWTLPGVSVTLVGYQGGHTPNPTYEEVCSGATGHVEVVRVVYDPAEISLDQLLKVFWESHDPTQGMRQGGDRGTQYRSAIYLHDESDLGIAVASRERYGAALAAAGMPAITTEIAMAGPFYAAESYHQQYLAKNPAGYCGLGGTGVACPIGAGVTAD